MYIRNKFFHNEFIAIHKNCNIIHEFFNIHKKWKHGECIELKNKIVFSTFEVLIMME